MMREIIRNRYYKLIQSITCKNERLKKMAAVLMVLVGVFFLVMGTYTTFIE